MTTVMGWLRVALRDLRGDLSHFGVLLACLALGVGAIAAVGSVGEALQAAIARDSRTVLGGDLEGQLSYRPANDVERAVFDRLGTYAEVIDVPGRARNDSASQFISIKAVDAKYPLLGEVAVTTTEKGTTADLLAERDGVWGILVNSLLIDRMALKQGDRFTIEEVPFEVRGVLDGLPDQVTQGFQIGVPTLMSIAALDATGLAHAGALARYRYKLVLDPGVSFADASATIKRESGEPAWDIRSPTQATETLAQFFSIFTRFLVIVGLSSLLVGGVGVSNAVGAYIVDRQRSIATLRSLGATSARILTHFLFQIMLLTLLGIVIGLILGAVLSLIALPIIGNLLNIKLDAAVHGSSLLTAAGFGLLVGFAFAFLPLARTRTMRPALLFRAAGGGAGAPWRWRDMLQPIVWAPLLVAAAGIVGLALLTTDRPILVFWYTVGTVGAFLVLRLAAAALQRLLRLVPPLPDANLRNALKAIYRPGAPAPAVILSLGLGLALLLLIGLVENNLRNQINGRISDEAPSFILTDLFDDEVDTMEGLSKTDPNIANFYSTPMMRAAITELAGKPVADYAPYPEDIGFLFDGEAPITWRGAFPAGASALDQGEWWPADYSGDPLVSLSTEFRDKMGLKIGDTVTVRLFGEPLTGTIKSFRKVDWQSGVNFAVIFSPGAIEKFPVNYIGMLKAADGREGEVQSMLVNDFPDLNFIAVGDALRLLTNILGTLSDAVSIVGGIAVVSGLFVLAGAMAAGRAQREADAVVMKVLGATRGDVIRAYLIEYGVLGALAAMLAAIIGSIGAWGFVTQVMEMEFTLDPVLIISVIAGAIVLTIATGTVMTWTALSVKPAPYLRGE